MAEADITAEGVAIMAAVGITAEGVAITAEGAEVMPVRPTMPRPFIVPPRRVTQSRRPGRSRRAPASP